MLDPNDRSLLSNLLTPPPGMAFDAGLATTFSLDPLTLLGVPLHLAWLAGADGQEALTDPVRLLEALQRVTRRLTVFADRGRMLVPPQHNALYALLEQAIFEVRAPRGGAFHPKLWVLRFIGGPEGQDVTLRLGVLSRNITSDRSWDLSLVLEGEPRGAFVKANRGLGALLSGLPDWAGPAIGEARRAQVESLADQLRRTKWGLPAGWEDVRFHVLGTKRRAFSLEPAHEIAVVSPFLTGPALERLRSGAGRAVALVSRPESLAALPRAAREGFEECLVLDDAAETEDGEADDAPATRGLHAKAILLRRGWYTHLFVGSANATSAAMLESKNVEVMAELVGRHSQVGRVDDLLDREGLGGVLESFEGEDLEPPDDEAARVTAALERARAEIVDAALRVRCTPAGASNWTLDLESDAAFTREAVRLRVRPLSTPPDRATTVDDPTGCRAVGLGTFDPADVTGLIGFELELEAQTLRFGLNLPLEGLPEERDAAILRRVVRNREGFLRYLRLLLAGVGAVIEDTPAGAASAGHAWAPALGGQADAVLEDLVRAWSREPDRLRDVQRVVAQLRGDDDAIVPPEFDAVWRVFEEALGDTK